MSTLINLLISFVMSSFFGHQMEEPQTTYHDNIHEEKIEIYQCLEIRQKMLEV